MTRFGIGSLVILSVALVACGGAGTPPPVEAEANAETAQPTSPDSQNTAQQEEKPVADIITSKLDRFAPTEVGLESGKIAEEHRAVIKKLVEAAQIIDELFLKQVHENNIKWREEIAQKPDAEQTLALFDVMYGPWDRLAEQEPFWGELKKPRGASFYPEDLTADELTKWIAGNPKSKKDFTSYFTKIVRKGDALEAVPYSEAYKQHLEPAAKLLEEAAALSKDKRLKKFLEMRAKSFRTNEYRQSDMAWMDLGDGDIEIVIGPYEVYEDALMGYKAAFEAFVTYRDPEYSKQLEQIKSYIPLMEDYLPIPKEHKNKNRGKAAPISVVDVLFTAGDTRAGVQTLAFNLPNDEVVREKKGFKMVMLRNVAHAKYDKILVPIAERLVRKEQIGNVSFDAFFNHTLVHETAHGLGPGKITVERDGKKIKTTVNEELKDLYPTIEEAKADTLGMYLNFLLIEKGMHPKSFSENMYASFLGGFFRSVRFGADEAHGQANVIQFNYLLEKGAIVRDADGRYGYNSDKMEEAVKSLSHDLLMLEALGDYQGSKEFIKKYGQMPDDLRQSLASMTDIPTDIRPTYPVLNQMASW